MSDEIPVGSPPAPPGRHAAPGGWYPDPARQGQERYWDGWQWTRNTRQQDRPVPAGPPSPYQPQPGPGQLPYQHPAGMQQGWGPNRPPVPMTADGVPLAGWGWRVLAFLIDWMLLSLLTEGIARLTGLSAALSRAMSAYQAYITEVVTTGAQMDLGHVVELLTPPEMYWMQLLTIAAFVIYHALMLRFRGATLGKLATGLRVVPAGQGRSPRGLRWGTAILRPAITQLMGMVPFLGLVDYLFPLWDRNRQTLHDKVVRTQVVRER